MRERETEIQRVSTNGGDRDGERTSVAKEEERNNHCRQRKSERSEVLQTSGGKFDTLQPCGWVTRDREYRKSSTKTISSCPPYH